MEKGDKEGLRKRNVSDGRLDKDVRTAGENGVPQNLAVDRLRKMAKQLRETCLEQMDKSLRQMIEDMVQEIEHSRPHLLSSLKVSDYAYSDSKSESNKKSLPEKRFMTRQSPLTEMFESEHIQTIYHIFIAILVMLFLNTVIYDYVDTGKLNLDFELIQWTFSEFHTAMAIWGAMFFSAVLIIYPGFQCWASKRRTNNKLWDCAWMTLYVLYICMFFYFPVVKMVENNLPPASSAIVLCEQVRLLMKIHAFVRSNIPRAHKYDPKEDENESNIACPDFSKFLYFLFVPTLVYRDQYPRCSQIRWNFVLNNFAQVVGCLFYTYFVFVRFCVPVFHKFGQEPMSPKNLVLTVFGCMLPSMLVFLCGFYCILHSWLNAFAEMLRFADRMFYKDWWNSTSFANYYRTWNVVVHDWLYTYIYADVHSLLKHSTYCKLAPTLTVFAVSALVHEYILAFMFRFFYPVLLFLFGFWGVLLVFITDKRKGHRYWNVFMWFALVLGTGILMSLYSMEYYARINCPRVSESFIDYFIPRSLMCDAIRQD